MAIVKLCYLKVGDKATVLDDVQDTSNSLLLKKGSIVEIKSASTELYQSQYHKCYVVTDLMGQQFPLKICECQLDPLTVYMKTMVEILLTNAFTLLLILLSILSREYFIKYFTFSPAIHFCTVFFIDIFSCCNSYTIFCLYQVLQRIFSFSTKRGE